MVNMNIVNEYIEKQRNQLKIKTENIFNVLDEMQASIQSITEQVIDNVKKTDDCERIYLQVDTLCNTINVKFFIEVDEELYDAYIENDFFDMSEEIDKIDNCDSVLFFKVVAFRTEEARDNFKKDGFLITVWDRTEYEKQKEEKRQMMSVTSLQGYTDIFNLCVCPADCENLENLGNGRFSCKRYSYTLLSIQSTDDIRCVLRCYFCQRAISKKKKTPQRIINTHVAQQTHTTPYTDD